MPPLARGAAFIDQAGAVLAADQGFLACLGLPPGGAEEALRARASAEPALAALLSGGGPPAVSLDGAAGLLEIERFPAPAGFLLLLRRPGDQDRLERAGWSAGLGGLAGALAHDVKNHLHAMALQVALLGEKLGESAGAAVGLHLATLRQQIAQVDEVVRRFVDLVDPGSAGQRDLGELVRDVVGLHAHALRLRRLKLELRGQDRGLRVVADPARVAGLLLVTVATALEEAARGAQVLVQVDGGPGWAGVSVGYDQGAAGPAAGDVLEDAGAAAVALGGQLVRSMEAGRVTVALRLPRDEHR
jgi:signal transduction histidine kinase